MSTKHTPGPWRWDSTVWDYDPKQNAPWLVTEASGDRVLSGAIKCTREADARLIAAAPELLWALIFITTVKCDGIDITPINEAYDKARAAIAKATGETQ